MDDRTSTSAARKLDEFFATSSDEQEVISGMVRASLLQAAERFEAAGSQGAATESTIPDFVTGLTGENAPTLIKALRLPGSLAAYSIPGCNRSALESSQVPKLGESKLLA